MEEAKVTSDIKNVEYRYNSGKYIIDASLANENDINFKVTNQYSIFTHKGVVSFKSINDAHHLDNIIDSAEEFLEKLKEKIARKELTLNPNTENLEVGFTEECKKGKSHKNIKFLIPTTKIEFTSDQFIDMLNKTLGRNGELEQQEVELKKTLEETLTKLRNI